MEPADVTPSVVIRDLHVKYRVFEEQRLSLHELIRRKFRSRRVSFVHAVRGVTLTFNHGEAVGVVGKNGSGKSTLLRTIAGLEKVDGGSVHVSAQAQFLGISAALDPQLSGHRNILIGGLAMGLSRVEVESSIDAVIEFSGLQDAIERPLRTYSSGMKSRLAFSIATMRAPEILLIDEALAVGDRSFRHRGLERINELKERANTIVMVTHNTNEIRRTCQRTVWLDEGIVRADGKTDEVLELYDASSDDESTSKPAGKPSGDKRSGGKQSGDKQSGGQREDAAPIQESAGISAGSPAAPGASTPPTP